MSRRPAHRVESAPVYTLPAELPSGTPLEAESRFYAAMAALLTERGTGAHELLAQYRALGREA